MKKCLWLVIAPGLIWGQTTAASFFNPLSSQGGIHLTGVSVFSGYYSSGATGLSGFEAAVQNPFLSGPIASGGMTASFAGSKSTEKSSFAWTYSPSYFNAFYGNNQVSNNGSVNQTLSVNWTRKLGSKWSLSASLTGTLADLRQLYFNPSTLSSIASMPTTFDDLAAALLAGKYTDSQMALLLTGAQLQASPQQAYLYGRRLLTAGGNMGLSWAPSGRMSISLTTAGTRTQSINGVGAFGASTTNSAGSALPQMTSAVASLSFSYSLSPRTQFGASISSSREFSSLQRGFRTTGNVSIGRTMSRRWFLQGQAGVGKLNYSQQTYAAPTAPQYLYGGSLGFKTEAHTFLVSYNKSLSDAYGLGSGSTGSATGAWTWRPARTLSISAGGGFQELNNNASFHSSRSWVGNAGIGKALGPHLSLSVSYMYVQFPPILRTAAIGDSDTGVSIGLNWSPAVYR